MKKSESKIKCPRCGISVPDGPEDSTEEELLCNSCYEEDERKHDEEAQEYKDFKRCAD